MTSEAHAEPNYWKVFWALLFLTLVEVGVFYLHIARFFFISALILLALMKAFLVAWNFMHLRFERWTLIFVTVVPLLLVMVLFFGLMPDIGRLPY